jgi:hypothetical protein
MNIYLTFLTFSSHSSKYCLWYRNIITKALKRNDNKRTLIKKFGYVELHHILPKCMCENEGQIKDNSNQVYLTAKEHFICHLILSKMFPENYKLKHAITSFQRSRNGKRKLSSGQYSIIKRLLSISISKTNTGKKPWNKGKKHSKETKDKIAKSQSGKIPWNKNPNKRKLLTRKEADLLHSDWMKENNPMKNQESVDKIREKALSASQSICCLFCKKLFGPGNFSRHKSHD